MELLSGAGHRLHAKPRLSQKRSGMGGTEERRIVCKLVGYVRLEGLSATAALRRLYEVSRLYINFF